MLLKIALPTDSITHKRAVILPKLAPAGVFLYETNITLALCKVLFPCNRCNRFAIEFENASENCVTDQINHQSTHTNFAQISPRRSIPLRDQQVSSLQGTYALGKSAQISPRRSIPLRDQQVDSLQGTYTLANSA